MKRILVRRMRKEDADPIKRIDKAITKSAASFDLKRIIEEEVEREQGGSFVAEIDGKVVGYMVSYVTSGNFGVNQCAWIAMFGVDPQYMGEGIGKKLAAKIFRFYKNKGITEVFISVKWYATDILSFCKTLGFTRSEFVNLQKSIK